MEIEERSSDYRNVTDVNEKVTEWLAKYFKTQNWNITDLLKTQNATVYLLIWPIMEQNVFRGFMNRDSIDPISKDLGPFFDEIGAEGKAKYFHDRYQDLKKYKRLTNSNKYESMETVLSKSYDTLTGEDKMILMMTTVFRYRNNIFHGNKTIGEWNEYHKELEYCTEFMMSVVDVYNKHFGNK